MERNTRFEQNQITESRYLSLIFHNTSELICLLEVEEIDYIFVSINPAYLASTKTSNKNLKSEDFIGSSLKDVFIKSLKMEQEHTNEILAMYSTAVQQKEPIYFTEQISVEGKKHFYSSIITPIIDDNNVCTHLLYSSTDITEKKDYEVKLETSEKKFRSLIENAYEGIVLYNHEGAIIYASPSIKNIGGYNETEIIGMLGTDFVHPDEYALSRETFAKVASTPGKSVTFRQRLLHKDGHYMWGETTLTNLLHEPAVKGIISNFRDITLQKLAEDELRESKQLLESINQNINEAIYRNVPNQKFEYVNNAFLEMFGFESIEELNKVKPASLYADSAKRDEIRKELSKNNSINNIEARFRRKNGSEFWGLISSNLVVDNSGRVLYDGSIRDITEEKIAREKLRESEQLLSSINLNIKEGIYRSSFEAGLIYVNDAFAEIFGFSSKEEILKSDIYKLYDDPNTRGELVKELRSKGSFRNKEILFKRKNGEKFWGLMSSYVIHGEEGELFDGAVRDITELKNAEKQLVALNNELKKQNSALASREEELNVAMKELSDRNFELDQIVYKTSHDLRSPLSSILGLVNIAKADKDEQSRDEYISRIEQSILKLDEFVKSMLNYAKASRVDVKIETLELRELIEGCIKDLEYLDNFESIETKINITGKSKSFSSDPLRLKIIFSNIISNAYKYSSDNVNQSYLNIDVDLSSKGMNIRFEDNGIGIETTHLSRIFDMFYRATEKSEGSGLGMYIVKQSVDKLDGTIDIQSTPEKGTKIDIYLPTHSR